MAISSVIVSSGLECSTCKGAFLILFTKRKEGGDEDMYNYLWPDACINPLEMVKLMHPDLYHDQCVHDGEDLPFCSELAAKVDDDWSFDNDKMLERRNRKYEDSICPSEVAYVMVMYNMKINLEQFCETFQCQLKVARDCFAHLGLLNPEFEEKYDLMFGEEEFEKRTAMQYGTAVYTSNKR